MAIRTQTRTFDGQAGPIECIIDWPDGAPQGWALVLHPHSLHGGSNTNKIVTTIARACVQRGLVTLRPNFRGVGESAGEFDAGAGEQADMLGLAEQFAAEHPDAAAGKWVVAGFSFGSSVAAQLYSARADGQQPVPDALLLFGCAVERFKSREVRVPADTMLVHGELDDVVPLEEAMSFALDHDLAVVVVPQAGHFFHGKLMILKNLLQQRLQVL